MSIKKRFDEMVYSVLEDYGSEIIKDKEYDELSHEYEEVFNKLKDLLPKEHWRLLYRLDEIDSEMGSISEKIIYEKGLQDGVELKHILRIAN